MKKKMKRYQDGGDIESMQGENPGIDDDTRARAMDYVARQQSKLVEEPPGSEEDKPKVKAKAKPKAESKAESKAELKAESKATSNKPASPVSSTREKTGFEKKKEAFLARPAAEPAPGKTTETKKEASPTARLMPSRPDREKTGFEKKKEAFLARTGMRVGGKVSSASKRADGIAQRGKTRA